MIVQNRNDLDKLHDQGRSTLYPDVLKISVGMATCGRAAGAGEVYKTLREAADRCGLEARFVVTGCIGYCQQEPLVDVRMPGRGRVLYARVSAKDARGLIEALAAGDLPGTGALALIEEAGPYGLMTQSGVPDVVMLNRLPFYEHQHKIVLRNSGLIDPLSIEEYVFHGGYKALSRALLDFSGDQVIETITQSGLRGRGGGGFPTGQKWQICRDVSADSKYIICNADEGDPGAYMDRTVLESDPYSVIEGLTIGGYAVGAATGYIYVRDEYPLAIERLNRALDRAKELGLLGKNILNSGFDFWVEIVRGAGAFVCGEETALIASIEGVHPEPRPKPPFPAVSGLWGRPTVVNNVKTFATVSEIINRGAQWYAAIGTEKNAGTVVFSLVGQVANTGLVEVPLGMTLHQLINEIGGGSFKSDKTVKALQTGGPSGGCIPATLFDLPIDYETLAKTGSIMGSGGMVVMDEDTCMVDVAQYFLGFTREESCGKCTACREGTRAMHEILGRITAGKGSLADLILLEDIGNWVKSVSLCGLGQTAPNPVLSTLRYFREEYLAHVQAQHCPAGVCRSLIRLKINPDRCNGCTLCQQVCPGDAISGVKKEVHVIQQEQCTRCRSCVDVCPEEAIEIGR